MAQPSLKFLGASTLEYKFDFDWLEKYFARFTRERNGCLLMRRVPNSAGCCTVAYKGKMYLAHRLAYILYHQLPDLDSNDLVLHTCDVPMCVKKEHLYVGDQAQNVYDREKRHRHPHDPRSYAGEKNHEAVLTEAQVAEIRARYRKGNRYKARGGSSGVELAREFGVSRALISLIVNNKVWATV